MNEITTLQARLRMLEELNLWLHQESNGACAALCEELTKEVEVAMLCCPSAQPFSLTSYPKHLDKPSICPICQSAFDVITKFYAVPYGHRYHIVCLLKALPAHFVELKSHKHCVWC